VVANAGVNGATTADALKHFDQAIAAGTDIALVEFSTNDLRSGASLQTVRAPDRADSLIVRAQDRGAGDRPRHPEA
jgi:lysophospholipase L1-like esterase